MKILTILFFIASYNISFYSMEYTNENNRISIIKLTLLTTMINLLHADNLFLNINNINDNNQFNITNNHTFSLVKQEHFKDLNILPTTQALKQNNNVLPTVAKNLLPNALSVFFQFNNFTAMNLLDIQSINIVQSLLIENLKGKNIKYLQNLNTVNQLNDNIDSFIKQYNNLNNLNDSIMKQLENICEIYDCNIKDFMTTSIVGPKIINQTINKINNTDNLQKPTTVSPTPSYIPDFSGSSSSSSSLYISTGTGSNGYVNPSANSYFINYGN